MLPNLVAQDGHVSGMLAQRMTEFRVVTPYGLVHHSKYLGRLDDMLRFFVRDLVDIPNPVTCQTDAVRTSARFVNFFVVRKKSTREPNNLMDFSKVEL